MAFWACASLARVDLTLHLLDLAGFATYCPRVRVERKSGGPDDTALLFPGYTFISIKMQWHRASRTPGVAKLIMDGEHPARVPDVVIDSLRARERDGLVVLPTRPKFQRGDATRITAGPFTNRIALYEGQRAHQRVAVLLQLFGTARQVELPRRAIARVR